MWNFASKCLVGTGGLRFWNGFRKLTHGGQQSPDDEASSTFSKEDALECPICYESFNVFENVPYVLWCGHSLCRNCVLGLHWAIVKIPSLPIQLPLLIACPWCSLLSPRLVLKGNLRFPRKNYFLLWMVERLNHDKVKTCLNGSSSDCWSSKSTPRSQISYSNVRRTQSLGSAPGHNRVVRICCYVRKSLLLFVELTAKLPLVVISLLIVVYVIPASAAILALYVLLTILFVFPSFLVLYFAYPSLDWLVKEIMA